MPSQNQTFFTAKTLIAQPPSRRSARNSLKEPIVDSPRPILSYRPTAASSSPIPPHKPPPTRAVYNFSALMQPPSTPKRKFPRKK